MTCGSILLLYTIKVLHRLHYLLTLYTFNLPFICITHGKDMHKMNKHFGLKRLNACDLDLHVIYHMDICYYEWCVINPIILY